MMKQTYRSPLVVAPCTILEDRTIPWSLYASMYGDLRRMVRMLLSVADPRVGLMNS